MDKQYKDTQIMDKKYAIETVNNYISYLINEQKLKLNQVYIFGSYAKNTQNNDSDIDVAIVFDNLNDRFEMQFNLMKWRRNFDLSIEPHPFVLSEFNKNNPFVYEIITNGLKLSKNNY